jgi:hypothetical protein
LDSLLAKLGNIDELRARAEAGDDLASSQVASILAGQGDIDGAVQVLWGLAVDGYKYAPDQLADLLFEHGRINELRALTAMVGDENPVGGRLAELLAKQGSVGELRVLAATDEYAAYQLADLLAREGRIEELRSLSAGASGEYTPADRLAEFLAEHGGTDELRTRADAGDESAEFHLAELLANQGRLDELRTLLTPVTNLLRSDCPPCSPSKAASTNSRQKSPQERQARLNGLMICGATRTAEALAP